MKTEYIAVDGTQDGINFDAHYKIGSVGVAWFLLGWAVKYEPITCLCVDDEGGEYEEETGEFDKVADTDHVVAVMVGDDRREVVELSDLELIPEDEFCRDCGQIGCTCNVYA